MKIGIISPTYPPNLNGISISLKKLVDQLIESGNEVYVAIPPVPGVSYPEYVIKLPILPFNNLFYSVLQDVSVPFNFKNAALRAFKERGVEVIHSHDTGILFWKSDEIAKELKVPHVHTYHTLMEEYVKILHPIGYRRIARHMTVNACNKAATVIAPTEKMKDYLVNLGVKTKIESLINIPNLDNIQIKIKDESLMSELGINKNDFVFISFGRVVKQKNIDLTIKYLAPILKDQKNVKLIVGGFGSEIKGLKKLSEELGVQDKVIFTGKYNGESISRLGSISDCFVITSRSETQCITILEAMKMGLPAVAVNDKAYLYVLKDHYNGLFIEDKNFTNACIDIYRNRELHNTLSENAIKSAEELNNKDFISEYIKIYKEAIARYQKQISVKS